MQHRVLTVKRQEDVVEVGLVTVEGEHVVPRECLHQRVDGPLSANTNRRAKTPSRGVSDTGERREPVVSKT